MVLAPKSTDLPKLTLKLGRWTVGSAATCSYRVVGAGVQPRHALILCGGSSIVLKSWDARTWVNGEPVHGEAKLSSGDRLVLGSLEFEIESPDADPRPESQAQIRANLDSHVEDVLDQLTESLDHTIRTIESESSTTDFNHEELDLLRQRVRDLEESTAVLRQQLESSQHNLEVLQEELALQHQLAEAVEQVSTDHSAWQKRASELDVVRANQEREKKVLAHSWEWLQTDRRQLVIDKEEWQHKYDQILAETHIWKSERQQWLTERDEFALSTASLVATNAEIEALRSEKTQWEQERQQIENEMRTVASDLEAARISVTAQQSEVAEEWSRLQATEESLKAIRSELDQKMDSLESLQQRLESQQQSMKSERQQLSSEQETLNQERESLDIQRLALLSERQTQLELSPYRNLETKLESTTFAKAPTVTRRIAIVHDSQDALLNASSTNAPWSHGVDLTEHTRNEFTTFPRPEMIVGAEIVAEQTGLQTIVDDWETPSGSDTVSKGVGAIRASTTSDNNADSKLNEEIAAADPAAVALRTELSRMFNLQKLEQAASVRSEVVRNDRSTKNDSAAHLDVKLEAADCAVLGVETHRNYIRDEPLKEGSESYGGVVMTTNKPTAREDVDPDESLSFNDDEPVDDSVGRYMQKLLARSRGWGEASSSEPHLESSTPIVSLNEAVQSEEKRAVPLLNTVTQPAEVRLSVSETDDVTAQSTVRELASSDFPQNNSTPAHKQDKHALRAVTENMREVANLQTLKNVETASWVRLQSSIKTKSALAAFSFVLCIGLLYLGFQSKPGFIVLGSCAACIGILTWVDLFMAIYKVRRCSKELDEQHRKRA
ncbi:MAG: FHA domain-containing protein [Planctomycetia bacterium]|nr:FHA domain-containing protein [Planctomycetia bacterium]